MPQKVNYVQEGELLLFGSMQQTEQAPIGVYKRLSSENLAAVQGRILALAARGWGGSATRCSATRCRVTSYNRKLWMVTT